jgi:hypothetical protein
MPGLRPVCNDSLATFSRLDLVFLELAAATLKLLEAGGARDGRRMAERCHLDVVRPDHGDNGALFFGWRTRDDRPILIGRLLSDQERVARRCRVRVAAGGNGFAHFPIAWVVTASRTEQAAYARRPSPPKSRRSQPAEEILSVSGWQPRRTGGSAAAAPDVAHRATPRCPSLLRCTSAPRAAPHQATRASRRRLPQPSQGVRYVVPGAESA